MNGILGGIMECYQITNNIDYLMMFMCSHSSTGIIPNLMWMLAVADPRPNHNCDCWHMCHPKIVTANNADNFNQNSCIHSQDNRPE